MTYGYPGYPPPPFWGYPQPNIQQMPMPLPPDIEARATKIAMKLMAKEQKKKDKAKEEETKKKDAEKKKAEEKSGYRLMFVEWYVLGALSYPFLGPLYRLAKHYAGVL